MRQLLMGIWDCGLKNDALLDVFYEKVTEVYQTEQEYAVYLFMTGMTFLQRRRIRNDWENLSRCLSI